MDGEKERGIERYEERRIEMVWMVRERWIERYEWSERDGCID